MDPGRCRCTPTMMVTMMVSKMMALTPPRRQCWCGSGRVAPRGHLTQRLRLRKLHLLARSLQEAAVAVLTPTRRPQIAIQRKREERAEGLRVVHGL